MEYISCVAIKKLERQVLIASHCGSKQQSRSLYYYCLFVSYIFVPCSAHIPFVVNRTFNATPTASLQQHPSFCNEPHLSHILFVKVPPGTSAGLR